MKIYGIIFFIITLTGCGSVSSFEFAAKENHRDISKYQTILIQDFTDKTKNQSLPDDVLKKFANKIESQIRDKGIFTNISYDESSVDEHALVIRGDITRYVKGNLLLKLVIGYGIGSSHFDAVVEIADHFNGDTIGQINVDKNSWWPGGPIAVPQTVDVLMNEAAKKIADQLYELKQPASTN